MSGETRVPVGRLREIAGDMLDMLWLEYGAEDDAALAPKAIALANRIRAMNAEFPGLFDTGEGQNDGV